MPPPPWKPNNSRLPDKIKCNGCKKEKTPEFFSSTQQNNAREEIRKTGRAFAKCTSCVQSASTRHEMKCQDCEQIKSKDEFAKAHRKNPDEAICMKCRKIRDVQEAPADVIRRQREEEQNQLAAEQDDEDDEEINDWGDESSAMTTNVWDTTTSDGVSLTSGPASHATSTAWNTASTAGATHAQDDDEEDSDDDLYSAPRRVPASRAATATRASDTATQVGGFRPVDPIANPSQYRRAPTAPSGNVPRPPTQATYQTDYNTSAPSKTLQFNDGDDSDSDPELY